MKLTAENVATVFFDCFYTEAELAEAGKGVVPKDAILVEGVATKVGFHPGRVASHRDEIASMLSELSDEFKVTGGGGMSFLQACYTKSEEHWGEHQNMEQLFLLGLAVKMVRLLLPREMWGALPGGMPYYVVNTEGFADEPKPAENVEV